MKWLLSPVHQHRGRSSTESRWDAATDTSRWIGRDGGDG